MISQLGYLFLIRKKKQKIAKKEKYSNINKRHKNHSNFFSNNNNTHYDNSDDFDNSDDNLFRRSLIYDKQNCLNCNGINYYNKKFCSLDCKSSFIMKSCVNIPNYLP